MRIFELERRQWLARSLPEVYAFFAEARNLESITPDWLHFKLLPPEPQEICKGTLIDYRLRWRGIPIRWRTEISEWQPPWRFVDRQLRGPYRLWVHEHRFAAERGGTSVSDWVRYAVPGGLLVQRLIVGRDVEAIFAYRAERLEEIFAA